MVGLHIPIGQRADEVLNVRLREKLHWFYQQESLCKQGVELFHFRFPANQQHDHVIQFIASERIAFAQKSAFLFLGVPFRRILKVHIGKLCHIQFDFGVVLKKGIWMSRDISLNRTADSGFSHSILLAKHLTAELAKLFGDEVPDMVQEYLDDIISSGHFMLNLVNDILDTNRLASGKLELHLKKIDIQHIIQDMRQIFGVTCADKGINLVFEPGENIHTVYADPVRIQRIFSNLLSNAIKFTPPGGTVYFRAIEREIIGDKYLVTIQVKDTGTGMSEEFQEHMFEIFAQEENDTNIFNIGTGLGLSIVKNLVELMGGTIRCSSKLGVGTEFFVTMPFQLAEEAEEEQSAEKCAIQEELLWDHRILLVEDHDLNAKIVTRLLESKQIQVERAKNGKEAVELYAASAPYSYDAILMDIQMPVMDGIEASKKIRMLERPDARLIPIIALTANVFDVDVQRSKAVEMNAHLVKPIDPQKLFRTLIALWK